jgi:DNA-binding response OmpR family regulator
MKGVYNPNWMAGGQTNVGSFFEPDRSTLYYVEDDADAVALFYTAMRRVKAGFRLEIATGLEQAFDHFAGLRARPMAVLLDHVLGQFEGNDLLRWMRQQPGLAKIEVAVFSGDDGEARIANCYKAGANYFVMKPNSFTELVHIVQSLDQGFRKPSKNLFLYPLVGSVWYRPPGIHPPEMGRQRLRVH